MGRTILYCLMLSWATWKAEGQEKVLVFAAANLSSLEKPLRAAFEPENPGSRLEFSYGASGTLVTQILNGAPAQLFLSADRDFAQKLVDAGMTTGPVRAYAQGRLIFLATRPMDLSRGLAVLLDPQIRQFALCNPAIAPYGRATVEALSRSGLLDRVRDKEVMGQSVTQALQFTLTATGFGFVNKSALFSGPVAPYAEEGVFWFDVDPNLYEPIEQGFVILKSGAKSPGTQAFATFLTSPNAQTVFRHFGYGPPH